MARCNEIEPSDPMGVNRRGDGQVTSRLWASLCARLVHFAGSFERRHLDCELAEELKAHIQMHIDDNLKAGMTPMLARRDALLKLGGVQQTLERCRDIRSMRGIDWIVDQFTQ